jgi:catechol 2,3-dioxygenase-like lactoylglutathione lyase family enzyme
LTICITTGINVSNFDQSKEFYTEALAPLGYQVLKEFDAAVTGFASMAGFGINGKPDFWILQAEVNTPRIHVAFSAGTCQQVDAFYNAAVVKAGGQDNGAPGLRPHYHANYYAAFVLDLEGHNIEAVCHNPRI